MSSPVRVKYEAYLKRISDEKAREGYVWDQGKAEGEQLLAALMERLFLDNRLEDAKLAASDEQARERLYREYKMEK